MTPPKSLALSALDEVDLAVIAACLQDALIRRADISYEATRRRFAFVASRFLWEDEAGEASMAREHRRARTGVHFDGVLAVKSRGLPPREAETPLGLMTIATAVDAAGAGSITLVFSGDASIRLEVECVDCHLRDLGPIWPTDKRPDHGLAG